MKTFEEMEQERAAESVVADYDFNMRQHRLKLGNLIKQATQEFTEMLSGPAELDISTIQKARATYDEGMEKARARMADIVAKEWEKQQAKEDLAWRTYLEVRAIALRLLGKKDLSFRDPYEIISRNRR